MKRIIIFGMLFLFAGCTWYESGRPDRRRYASERHEMMGTQRQHQDYGQPGIQGEPQGHLHGGN